MQLYRNSEVSPLMPLLLVIYPVFETVFSMYRRKVLRGRPVTQPDGIHLHTFIYRRVMRWAAHSGDPAAMARGNSRTSPVLWALTALSVIPARDLAERHAHDRARDRRVRSRIPHPVLAHRALPHAALARAQRRARLTIRVRVS